MRFKLLSFAASALAALLVAAPQLTTAQAAGVLISGSGGTDISWPQCGHGNPEGYAFVVVGVTGGRPYTGNPCFAEQYGWAAGNNSRATEVYVNLDFGMNPEGPLSCMEGEDFCQAYNYGYDAAAAAYTYAARQTNGATFLQPVWWLDVETENSWSDNVDLNSFVIQGAIDFLQRTEGVTAGVYSTSHMWQLIAGSYAPTGIPNWVAGAAGTDDYGKCGAALWAGGEVWAFQYLNFGIDLDQNTAC